MPIVNPSASPAIPGVTTIASVSLFSDVRALRAGQYPLVMVLGGTVVGDGQDGVFYWSASSLAADDGLTVLAPNAGGTGRWIRLYSGFSLSSGASHVSTVQSGTTPTRGTVAAAINDLCFNVRNAPFNATGDGITDDAAAITAAIAAAVTAGGGVVYFPAGTYLIGSQLTVSDGKFVEIRGTGIGSQIKKGFNGAMISLGSQSVMRDLYLNGNGASFTGRGVIIESGDLDLTSWRLLENLKILDCTSYAVEFTQAKAGYGSYIVNSRMFYNTNPSQAQIKFPASETNGNRHLTNVFTFGSAFADFAGTNNAQVVGCLGGIPSFGTGSNKVTISGSRFTSTSDGLITDFQPKGVAHVIVGNTINVASVTFHSSLAQFHWAGNSVASGATFTDNATGTADGNSIHIEQRIGTPTWTSSGTAPALGDGQIGSAYTRSGERCKFNMFFIAGSTTTFGTGVWSFSLPYTPAARGVTGTCLIRDASSANEYAAIALEEAAATVSILASTNTTKVGTAIPFTWASGDRLYLDIEFPIA